MKTDRSEIFETYSPEETVSIGEKIGRNLKKGDIVALWGEMGAGKTTITRGIAKALGVPPGVPVTSPTFTLINEYDGKVKLYHIDFYRIASVDELETIPLREVFYGDGIAVIEWPDKLEKYLPETRWDVIIEFIEEDKRRIKVKKSEGDGF